MAKVAPYDEKRGYIFTMSTGTRSRADPKRGTTCARQGCSKPPVSAPQHIPRARRSADYERDPFCSSECCKQYYGVKVQEPKPQGRSSRRLR